jgi:hypothetical protein
MLCNIRSRFPCPCQGVRLDERGAMALFAMMDANGSGVIELEDFVQFMDSHWTRTQVCGCWVLRMRCCAAACAHIVPSDAVIIMFECLCVSLLYHARSL